MARPPFTLATQGQHGPSATVNAEFRIGVGPGGARGKGSLEIVFDGTEPAWRVKPCFLTVEIGDFSTSAMPIEIGGKLAVE